ncbi:ATP-binding protein [Sphingobacterium sp. UT-1RO-CII-1]|uniref:tetratricopeptide repeat-containing sensor histidine kinase n=1 Tax=Sphingobacterium sp. UT-1RO-CII-1 TaxID=2995225 RepID=UPI00227C5672|nr:tetratricopeptide repeat-containing sensor histidine kinase [Sphingobacterium sp. UT-1RO-CII-1]MCY4779542.1 ATP-binding protein [Sphingobacterium sp. UT-1RO-CII-1]
MRLNLLFLLFLFIACREQEEKKAINLGNSHYHEAYDFFSRKVNDSAFYSFSKAKDLFFENNDSLNIANCLINMAIIQKDAGDLFGAQETALEAIDYLNENEQGHYSYLSSNYNNLGVATLNLNDYENALKFFKLALQFSTDSLYKNIYQNNTAIVYQNRKEYDKAIDIYEDIYEQVKDNDLEYARVVSNLARAKWLKDSTYVASNELLQALEIRKDMNDLWGMNASYGHLMDYYSENKPDSALWYADKMYETSKKLKSDDDQVYALNKLVELSPAIESKYYFGLYKTLSDSLQNVRAAAKNQFAVIRYEVEKNKSHNIQLKSENAEKTYRLTLQKFWTAGIAIVGVMLIVFVFIFYRRRKQRFELQAQNQIKANQLKISQKVHDVVANGIYRLMIEIEHRPDTIFERNQILDQLEDMYNKSRDISYEDFVSKVELPYNEQIASLLRSFANDYRLVLIAGNEKNLWDRVAIASKEELLKVLQELMVNMVKHSRATHVVVRFEEDQNYLKVYYSDNGVGMTDKVAHGNGLMNTVSRIENIGGRIIFVEELDRKGLKIEVHVPLL